MTWKTAFVCALTALLVLGTLTPLLAQDAEPDSRINSPRATIETFITALNPPDGGAIDMSAALLCMDFSGVDKLVREEKQDELALHLKEIIDRIERFDFETLPLDDPESEDDNGPFLLKEFPAGKVEVVRGEGGNWRFSAATVAAIPPILVDARKLERVAGADREISIEDSPAAWLESKIPDGLLKTGFLLAHWQWIGLLILIILGIIVERIVAGVIPALFRRSLKKRKLDVGKRTARFGFRPFGVLAMALVWWVLIDWLLLPHQVYLVLVVAIRFIAAAAGVWCAYRLVDVVADVLKRKAGETTTRFDDLLVPLFRKSMKIFVTVVGIVFLASVLQINVTSILAGLGLGGLAFTLAAQDSVKNLFGSVTVIMDRPFQVGDWVKIGSTEGSVEEVGFRSTRVRTFYNSLITVPNGNLISAVVDNMGARRYRRVKTMLSLTYDTPPDKIEAFCEGIRELIRRHPYTRKDYFHVYFNQFAAASLDVLLYAFLETPEWGTELREKQRLFTDILRLANRLDVEFAFPTQTLHVVKDDGSEPEEMPYPHEDDARDALDLGRTTARAIVAGSLGEPQKVPPPVGANISELENRGEDDGDGDGGE